VAVTFKRPVPDEHDRLVSLFLNGTLVARNDDFPREIFGLLDVSAETWLGGDALNEPSGFTWNLWGQLADVRISEGILYPPQDVACGAVGVHCFAPAPCLGAGAATLAYWPLSEGSGRVARNLAAPREGEQDISASIAGIVEDDGSRWLKRYDPNDSGYHCSSRAQ